MMRRLSVFCLLLTLLIAAPAVCQQTQALQPPVAKKIPHVYQIHGDTITDNYYWLREKTNPEVKAYLDAENAYTDQVMKPEEGLQKKLYQEIAGRIKETDVTVPYKEGNFYYYSRTEQGKQYSIFCRKAGSLDAPEQVMLDLNQLAADHSFVGLGGYSVSDDGNLFAYTIDFTGFRQYVLFVKDLRTGKVLPDTAQRVDAADWASDNKTLFYVVENDAKRPYRLYRHVLGQDAATDVLVYEEKDTLYNLDAYRSRDKRFIVVDSAAETSNEARYIPADHPDTEPTVVLPREKDHEYSIEPYKDTFFIRTNKDAKTFRIVSAPISDPRPQNWKDFVPYRKEVTVGAIDCFAGHCVVVETEDALRHLRVFDMATGKSARIPMPEPVYTVMGAANPEFNSTKYRYGYQSMTTPLSYYDYDMVTGKSKLLKRQEVLGGYYPANYETERIWATAADGVRVPISIVYRKGLKKDGKSPLLLYGYGSYGAPSMVNFVSARISLLDRGISYAIAHVRGGGDLGQEWYEDGKMMKKRNTFTDFIACAEYLVQQKYTSPDRLVIEGASAGGLLMGAVANMRPDLFKAVILGVPFVDVINTMLDDTLPLTTQEYVEWGNPNIKEQYEYIKTYSPYDNIEAKNYPAMLVRTSFNDSQVMYHEPAKYVAKMRATRTDKNTLLLKVVMAGGHGGPSGRYDSWKELAFNYSFILTQLGINH